MNWYKKSQEEIDLFDPVEEAKVKKQVYDAVFADQDEWAKKSKVFNAILQSEIKDNPKERYESTNNPRAKTRNALLIRPIYKTLEEWEKHLLTDLYYELV